MLEMTQALVDAANRGSPIEFVQIAREQIGRDTLMGNALAQAMKGRTTIEEAMRVSVQIDP
jgi:MSHA biogenesis protein MshE